MCCSFFPLTWGSRTVKAGIDSSAEGRCGYADGLELLGQLRQPAFQEPSLGLLAGEGKRPLVQRRSFSDLGAVPDRAVLVLEEDEVAIRRRARGAPRFLQKHEREKPHGLGLREQLDQQAPEADRLRREINPRERASGRG